MIPDPDQDPDLTEEEKEDKATIVTIITATPKIKIIWVAGK